jgi:soluble lytic murein transglycosylase-like protein
MRMRVFLCAAAVVALAIPAVAHEKSRRVRAEVQPAPLMNPFTFFRSMFVPAQMPQGRVARVDRTNKESRLAIAEPQPIAMPQLFPVLPQPQQGRFGTRIVPGEPVAPAARPYGWDSSMDASIARHAAAHGVPIELARRVVKRESGGNPRAVSQGNYGLMQIRLGTARAMGYQGNAQGLLDPDVNMTYAMRYLAGAHRAAGGNPDRAVALYARGYYYEAKAQGFSPYAQQPRAAVATFSPFSAYGRVD